MNYELQKVVEVVYRTIIVALCLYALYWVVQVTTACSFHTPSGSMYPTLKPDESGLVNKWKLGARIFNIFDAADGKPYEIRRLPGYGSLERGDVIIFNYPYQGKKEDSIAMNLGLYYCKRAVAVAGDTLEIRDCFYKVRGCPDTLGVASAQRELRRIMRDHRRLEPDPRRWPGWMRGQPRDSLFGWTIQHMGPLVIPEAGLTMEIDRRNFLLYRRYIEWETKKKLTWQDSCAFLAEKPIKFYKFAEDYCFEAGDNAPDSCDSLILLAIS